MRWTNIAWGNAQLVTDASVQRRMGAAAQDDDVADHD